MTLITDAEIAAGHKGVDTKLRATPRFGNDSSIGFIRVRKRKLKGGHQGTSATKSSSFDLVRAVRVNGKPRQEFVLGLGSQKNRERHGFVGFWVRAISRMDKHGLDAEQRRDLAIELIRKGAKLPSVAKCKDSSWARIGWAEDAFAELVELIESGSASLPKVIPVRHLITTGRQPQQGDVQTRIIGGANGTDR